MLKKIVKVFLIINCSMFLNAKENEPDANVRKITGTVNIDGYIATCYSKCIFDDNLKSCEWTDGKFVKHYSHGHCPTDERMLKIQEEKKEQDYSKYKF